MAFVVTSVSMFNNFIPICKEQETFTIADNILQVHGNLLQDAKIKKTERYF
jgi:hypothetical protein